MSITARVRNNGSLNWNLAAIYIIGLSIKVRCLSGERWLDKQDFLKALRVARARRNPVSLPDMTRDITTFYCLLPWISAILILRRTKKHKLRAQHGIIIRQSLSSSSSSSSSSILLLLYSYRTKTFFKTLHVICPVIVLPFLKKLLFSCKKSIYLYFYQLNLKITLSLARFVIFITTNSVIQAL